MDRHNGQLTPWLSRREKPAPDLLEAEELALLVRATLSHLPSDYGALLMAKYMDGATLQELAAVENRSSTAVRSRLARARRAFRDAFSKYHRPEQ